MSKKQPIVLFTPYFMARTPERQAEFDECLRRNIACEEISRIILLIDDGCEPSVKDRKLEVIHISRRPTYQQWVDLSLKLGEASISVLANTDICFDSTMGNIRKALRAPETLMALSRWEQQGENLVQHPNPHWSQDTWAFHTADALPETLYKALDIPLGVPRCDNRIAYLFAIHGWKVVNPAEHLRSIHVHETQQRNYDKKTDRTVLGGVAYVHPGEAVDDAANIDIDIWATGTQAIKKVSLNKSLDVWAKEASSTAAKGAPVSGGSNANLKNRPSASTRDFLTAGTLVYDHLRRFRIYRFEDKLLCLDGLYPTKLRYLPLKDGGRQSFQQLDPELLAVWIPPVLDTSPINIKDRPESQDDLHFWQYPCATEKQAYENHLLIKPGANIDHERRVIHTYVPLPWATYIDKKRYPTQVDALIKPRLMGMRSLAEANGYSLAVHTVCQQIHWRRFVEYFNNLGITDLHISHCEKSVDQERDSFRFHVHSWPLIAVNVEDPSRSAGLIEGKPIGEKRYLASFIGAHMKHYRSDVRLRLLEAAKKDGGADIFVDLGGEWHFNKVVYQEQVANKKITDNQQEAMEASTRRYNEILSDSIFSLCPEGAGPNTLRVWESLAVGAIPVIIADDWVFPTIHGAEISFKDCCIFVNSWELDKVYPILRGIKRTQVKGMQSMCIELYRKVRLHRAF